MKQGKILWNDTKTEQSDTLRGINLKMYCFYTSKTLKYFNQGSHLADNEEDVPKRLVA